jgi:ribose transport system substrate-binding protein
LFSPPKPPKAVKTVVFITNSTSDFWKVAQKGCEKADAELPDVTVAFKPTNTGTIEEQNGLIRQALDRDDADAIAISPVDPGGQKKVINDAAKKAFVMTQDSDAPDTDRTLYLGADNRAAGRQAGELIKQALPQGGKIMVFVGKREVQNAHIAHIYEIGKKDGMHFIAVEYVDGFTLRRLINETD